MNAVTKQSTVAPAAAFPVRPPLRRHSFARELIETAVLVVIIYTLVNLTTVRFFIDGPSMQPTFHAGEFLIVSRVNYLLGSPECGDIVVFDAPGSEADDPPLIKRLIGIPGDTVEVRDDGVYINGAALQEPYTKELTSARRCRDCVWQLGPNEYFLMGDNRNNSRDSRMFGPVTHDRIIGEAVIRYWPTSDWGIVARAGYDDQLP